MRHPESRPPDRRGRGALAIGGAAIAGFGAGAFLMAALVWHHGDIVGSPASPTLASPPSAVERWSPGGERLSPRPAPAPEKPEEGPAPPAPVGPAGRAAEGDAAVPPATRDSAAAILAERDLLLPVAGVTPSQLVRSFSDPRGARTHHAIDILAPRNTPVLAADAGTVARLLNSRAGGVSIYQFDEAREFVFFYAHLERYAAGLREGQTVDKGQVIGYVGVSGNAPEDTPHLHFAIHRVEPGRWWGGTPVDPYDLLSP